MIVVCPGCGADVPVTTAAATVRCPRCAAPTPRPAPAARTVRSERDDPRVDERWVDGALHLRLTPQRWGAMPLVFFAVVWGLFLAGWIRAVVLAPTSVGVAGWLPVALAVVAALIAWEALAVLVNRTTVTLDFRALQARHAPLPRPGAVRRPTAGLAGFAAAPREARWALQVGLDAFAPLRWTVVARTGDGAAIPLPLSLPTEARARRLAARLDEALRAVRTPAGYRA